jgi:hypothetical protein
MTFICDLFSCQLLWLELIIKLLINGKSIRNKPYLNSSQNLSAFYSVSSSVGLKICAQNYHELHLHSLFSNFNIICTSSNRSETHRLLFKPFNDKTVSA